MPFFIGSLFCVRLRLTMNTNYAAECGGPGLEMVTKAIPWVSQRFDARLPIHNSFMISFLLLVLPEWIVDMHTNRPEIFSVCPEPRPLSIASEQLRDGMRIMSNHGLLYVK